MLPRRSTAMPSPRSCSVRPASGAIANNFYPTLRWNYNAPWVQDDWRLTDKLTLNLGFRWDFNTPVFEEDNRLNYVFDTTSTNPVNSSYQHRAPAERRPAARRTNVRRGEWQPEVPVSVRQEQHPAACRVRLSAERQDGGARWVRSVLHQRRRHRVVGWLRDRDAADYVARRRSELHVPVLQSVLAGHPGGARVVARAGNASRPRSVFREHRLRESLRAPVLAGLPATVAVADDRGARLRRQPHARRAEPLGGIQHATRVAPRSLRSHQGRFGGVLQRAAAESVLRGRRIRGDKSVHESDAVPARVEPAISTVHADHRARSERRAGSGTTRPS